MTRKIKITLRPGEHLSEGYANSRNNFKVVETGYVLGYVVSGGGRASAAAIYPLYRATIHIKIGKVWHIVSSYEQGDRLNDYSFQEDLEGCALATIASQAVGALVERQRTRDRIQKLAKSSARKRSRRKA